MRLLINFYKNNLEYEYQSYDSDMYKIARNINGKKEGGFFLFVQGKSCLRS